jgi:signal peptidase I
MIPALRAGDTILLDQDAYRYAAPAIGDIVVFHPPIGAESAGHCAIRPPAGQACATADRRQSTAKFVKRIVAGPGDRISIRAGHVIRNGTPAAEDFITPCGPAGEGCDFPLTFTVTAGRYYVLGDNRGASHDSRYWGPIAASSILGRVRSVGP